MAEYRAIPSVDRLLAHPAVAHLAQRYAREAVVALVRRELAILRQHLSDGSPPASAEAVALAVERAAQREWSVGPRRVINATGVIVHTNLGRSPVSEEALQAAVEASRGYSNLEYDLYEGERGHRMGHVASLLTQLTGAEAALAVNNNASAVMLVLATFCVGKEVVVSRGEAVEIGGGFRIPDVLRQSGATLVEVGTTNRTYVRDYQAATTPDTAAYLKVHASNFRVTGFTHEATLAELARLGKERAVLVIHDLGSGSLLRTEHYGMAHEPMPQESVEAGADLVCFSTDKLLGGPQGGVVIGKQELVERLARHPLTRALRMGKLDLAALSATLGHYLKGEAQAKIPIWRMVSAPLEEMNARARGWCAAIGSRASVIDGQSTVGGGSLPGETLPTRLMALRVADLPGGAEGVLRRLREAEMPVIGRILDDQVVLDPRTVFAEEDVPLLQAVRKVVGA